MRKAKLPSVPRSAAVLLTLHPEAVARGLSYSGAILRGRLALDLPGLGLSKLSVRETKTGARVIEIPGPRGAEQADQLAASLGVGLADVATMGRPTKRVNVRITGLDDSISKDKLLTAVASKGDCSPADVRVREIYMVGPSLGRSHVSLPVAAAKSLVEGGPLSVRWSWARVRVLEQKPLRCFRCIGMGNEFFTLC